MRAICTVNRLTEGTASILRDSDGGGGGGGGDDDDGASLLFVDTPRN